MAIAKKGKQIGEETKKKLICISCGCGVQNNFNATKDEYHKFFNKIPYCKDCVKSIYKGYLVKYNGNTNLAIYFTCRKIDIPYIHQAYLAAMKESQNENSVLNGEENLLPIYLKNLAFADKNGWGSSFDDSQGENNIEGLSNYDVYTKIKRPKKVAGELGDDDNYEDIEFSTAYLQSVWGRFDNDDLAYLQNEYMDWESKLGQIDTKDIDIIVRQICYQTLDINKARENGEDVTKKLNALTSLMNNGGLLEKQNRAVQNSKVVGQRIEDIETFRPVKKADPELSDVDNINLLFDAFAGCTARALGKNNKYVEKFEKEFEPWSIDIIEKGKAQLLGTESDEECQSQTKSQSED